MKRSLQAGFSLIELMIVVTIIGVLGAIAVPQYQNYIARSQVSEAVNLVAPLRIAVEEYYQTKGTLVDIDTLGPLAALAATDAGVYVDSLTATLGNTGANTAIVTATFKTNPPCAAAIAQKTLAFTITPTTTDATTGAITAGTLLITTSGSTVPAKLYPSGIQTD